MKIHYDYFWLERQAWIRRLQPKDNPWIDAAMWCLLGTLITCILLAW